MKFVVSTLQVKSDEIHDQQNQLKRFNDPKITLHHLHQHREIPWKRLNPMGKKTPRKSWDIQQTNAEKHKKTTTPAKKHLKMPTQVETLSKTIHCGSQKNSRFPLSTKVYKLSSRAVIFPQRFIHQITQNIHKKIIPPKLSELLTPHTYPHTYIYNIYIYI